MSKSAHVKWVQALFCGGENKVPEHVLQFLHRFVVIIQIYYQYMKEYQNPFYTHTHWRGA